MVEVVYKHFGKPDNFQGRTSEPQHPPNVPRGEPNAPQDIPDVLQANTSENAVQRMVCTEETGKLVISEVKKVSGQEINATYSGETYVNGSAQNPDQDN